MLGAYCARNSEAEAIGRETNIEITHNLGNLRSKIYIYTAQLLLKAQTEADKVKEEREQAEDFNHFM